MTSTHFEIATWYDTWNQTGLNNLKDKLVPLTYATRYNLAFAALVKMPSGGYVVQMTGSYAAEVKEQILAQAPGVIVYAGLGSDGIVETVSDNALYQNRSTKAIVKWLVTHGYSGISIDAEELQIMKSVPSLVRQLGPAFKAAGLGLAVSAPWPESGVTWLYGDDAVQAFNEHVDAIELQDYSDHTGTPGHVPKWISAGIKASILMGGVCTENSDAQTSLEDTQGWTRYAMSNGLRGMFSWRLDNDHGNKGQEEDVEPTFTGAKTLYETVHGG